MRRQLLFATCLAALFVLQLRADNQEPPSIEVSISPDAGLLGSVVQFTANVSKSGSGGSGTYWYDWTIDGAKQPQQNNVNTLNYTIPAGDENAKEITISCTVTDKDDAGITDTDDITFWQVKVTLKRDGAEITGTPEVWAGQRMSLSANLLPSGVSILQHNWAVTQRRIADYIMTESEGRVVECSSDDCELPEVTFFWVDGNPQGISKCVTYKPTVGSTELTVSQNFVVRTPDCDYELSPLADVACDTDWHGWIPGCIVLHLGNLNPPGFSVRLRTYLPSGHSHRWVQIVQGDRIWQAPTGIWLQTFKRGLDFMYEFMGIEDSPSLQVLWLSFEMEATDDMNTVLLYRPPGDSIYVPLHAVYWGWYGCASRTGSNWSVDREDTYRGQMMTWPFHPVW